MTDPNIVAKGYSSSNVTSQTATATANAAVGRELVAYVMGSGNGVAFTFSDSVGNTWTQIDTVTNPTASAKSTVTAFKSVLTHAIVSGSTVFTAGRPSTSSLGLCIVDITTAGLTLTLDGAVSKTDGDSTNPKVTAAMTIAATSGVLFAVAQNSAAATITSTDWTADTLESGAVTVTNGRAFFLQYGPPGSTSVTPGVHSANQPWVVMALPFAQASGGGPSDAAYYWDGSALVACDAYWWDGSALTAMDPYWWDGSTLV